MVHSIQNRYKNNESTSYFRMKKKASVCNLYENTKKLNLSEK